LCVVALRERWKERFSRPRLVRWPGIAALIAMPGVWILMLLLTR